MSEEKIIISDVHFCYTRKLAIINFEKFEINLNEIKRITKILMKAPTSFSINIPALAILWYFKEQKRIVIKEINEFFFLRYGIFQQKNSHLQHILEHQKIM